jgi:hypothetical protein
MQIDQEQVLIPRVLPAGPQVSYHLFDAAVFKPVGCRENGETANIQKARLFTSLLSNEIHEVNSAILKAAYIRQTNQAVQSRQFRLE